MTNFAGTIDLTPQVAGQTVGSGGNVVVTLSGTIDASKRQQYTILFTIEGRRADGTICTGMNTLTFEAGNVGGAPSPLAPSIGSTPTSMGMGTGPTPTNPTGGMGAGEGTPTIPSGGITPTIPSGGITPTIPSGGMGAGTGEATPSGGMGTMGAGDTTSTTPGTGVGTPTIPSASGPLPPTVAWVVGPPEPVKLT